MLIDFTKTQIMKCLNTLVFMAWWILGFLKCSQSNETNDKVKYFISKSVLSDYIQVNSHDKTKNDLLNRFLFSKVYQNNEKIVSFIILTSQIIFAFLNILIKNVMLVPELLNKIDNPLHIIKNEKVNNSSYFIGEKICNLESIAYTSSRLPIPICPWHWILVEREDKFPFKRANAQCNCQDCLAKTIYDSNMKKFSGCNQHFVLMPMLWRNAIVNTTETWSFHLEEVPVSCICSIRLTPFLV